MDLNGISSLIAPTLAEPGLGKSSKLHNAAQQFEALVIGEMLRAGRESGSDGWLGSGDEAGDDSALDMAEGQLSNALAAGGGLGLAKTIEKTLRQPDTQTGWHAPATRASGE
jgi:Rod binding domain-containing protein